jgi:hypothetical protein
MSSQNKDEILSNFIAITQCPSHEAREYLEAAKWDEQIAMDFFFDSGASPARDPIPPINTRSSPTNTRKNIPGLY